MQVLPAEAQDLQELELKMVVTHQARLLGTEFRSSGRVLRCIIRLFENSLVFKYELSFRMAARDKAGNLAKI